MVIKGDKFNYLTMISDAKNGKAVFKCECGNEKEIRIKDVKRGKTMSCGCLQRKMTGERFYKHGASGTRLCRIWRAMKTRCYNPNVKDAKDYSDRGITVCDEWKNEFAKFQKWAIENGYDDSLTIDRIDVDKGYSPENCRWATAKEQRRNQRRTIRATINGIEKPLIEWCEELGANYYTVKYRVEHGWNVETAIIKPSKRRA